MPIKYEYDREKNIVYGYPYGLVSMSDITQYFDNLVEDSKVGSDFIEIVNLDEVTEFRLSYKEALQLPDLFAKVNNTKKHRGTILIGKKDFQFGMARMMSTITENDFSVRVVRSLEDAEKALEELLG